MKNIELNNYETDKVTYLKKKLIQIYKRKNLPKIQDYSNLLDKIIYTLEHENSEIRPYSNSNIPGGFIQLKKDISTIIIPDIHARIDFLINIMFYKVNNKTILEELSDNNMQIVCVGDGFHAESRAVKRWQIALEEYKSDFEKHSHMDEEMRESFGVMEIVMELKNSFPDNFHFLKGNHENILNENTDGNYSFRKFALEGPMVLRFVEKFYGIDFLIKYSFFEKSLPLLAMGNNFIVSHCEPLKFYTKEEIIEYKNNPELIINLTWTDNDAAEKDSVEKMLKYYFPNNNIENYLYFGGHRPVYSLYNIRANGKYVQIHNPNKFIVGFIKPKGLINLDKDIIEIPDRTKEIIKNY
ncbi:MAG: metallophosphoesterase [Spirochaetes bacterium]|nr:metallophosphoesterase [Spirochaetota bacterium]